MATAFRITPSIYAARIGNTPGGSFIGEVARLVREGGVISPEFEKRMSAAGLGLDRLHRSLLRARR